MDETLLEQQTEWERMFFGSGNKKLYKYRSDIYRDLFTLQNGLIYVPSREQLNDPNESSLNLTDVYETIQQYELNHPPVDGISLEEDMRNMIDNIGIFSMCKSQCEECLWSYYANGHRGFCVEYDAKLLWDILSRKDIVKSVLDVEYSDKKVNATIHNVREYISHPIDFIRKTTAAKSMNWKGEKEVRFICKIKSQYVDIPKEAITGIYVGNRCSDESISLIKKTVNAIGNSELRLYRMGFVENSFDMRFEEIKV